MFKMVIFKMQLKINHQDRDVDSQNKNNTLARVNFEKVGATPQIVKNIKLYNYALSDVNGETELRLPLRSNSIFKDNIEELFQLGAATMHPNNDISKFNDDNINIRAASSNIFPKMMENLANF